MADDTALTLPLDADPRALTANIARAAASLDRGLAQMESRAAASQATLNSILNRIKLPDRAPSEIKTFEDAFARIGNGAGNAEKALANVFDRSGLAVLEEGSAKIPIFGSALADLGPAGLAAGAGLAAVAAGVAEAVGFADYAADVERTSKALGLSVEATQEFHYVATALNIPVQELDESLSGLQKTIGAVESGLARAQTQRAFKLLNISPEDLKNAGTLEKQLPLILDAASKLNAAERAADAKRLGMSPEVLNSLIEGRQRIAGLIDEAHQMGLVLDKDAIQKGAEASVKLKEMSEVIDINLKTAFADLIPVIGQVAKALIDAVKWVNDFVQSFKPIDQRNESAIRDKIAELQNEQQANQSDTGPFGIPRDRSLDRSSAVIGGQIVALKYRLAQIQAQEHADELAAGAGASPTLPPTGHAHANHDEEKLTEAQKALVEAEIKAAADLDTQHKLRLQLIELDRQEALERAQSIKNPKTRAAAVQAANLTADSDTQAENQSYAKAQADRTRAFNDQLTKLQTEQLKSQAEISGALADRQAAETAAVAAEIAAQRQELADQIAKAAESKNAYSATQVAQLQSAQSAREKAETDALASKQATETANAEADTRIKILQQTVRQLKAAEQLASTDEERLPIERQILADEKQIAELELGKTVRNEHLTPDQAAADQSAINADFAAQGQQANRQFAGPIGAALNQIPQTGAQIRQALGEDAVSGVHALEDALVGLADGTEKPAQAFKKLAQGIIDDLLRLVIRMEIERPLLQLLGFAIGGPIGGIASATTQEAAAGFGEVSGLFASGTDSLPPGVSVVGENGPELLNNPSGGGQIIPNSTLATLARGTLAVPAARHGTLIIQPLHFHAEGAVTSDALIAQFTAISRAHAAQAATLATAQSRAGLFNANTQDHLLRG